MHCDNCAGDLPAASIDAIVHGTPVALCSGRCIAQLLTVWAPTRPVFPWQQALACLVVLVVGALL